MRKLNNYIRFGLLVYVIWLLFKQFFQVPELLNGLCSGIGISLMLWGTYIENHNISKIKNFKRKIFSSLRN